MVYEKEKESPLWAESMSWMSNCARSKRAPSGGDGLRGWSGLLGAIAGFSSCGRLEIGCSNILFLKATHLPFCRSSPDRW